MLTLYRENYLPEDSFIPSMTFEERERMQVLERDRIIGFEKYYKFGVANEPSIVLDDFLFLGNFQHATNQRLLEHFNIKHIINVCDLVLTQTIHNNFDVLHIPMSDDCRTNIKKHFDQTNELLHSFYKKRERCLVHCAAGVSRSATIVLAYLMKYHHNTLQEAFYFLIQKRPQIWPNEGFMIQLMRYETELIRSRELSYRDRSIENLRRQGNPIETLYEFEHKYEKH